MVLARGELRYVLILLWCLVILTESHSLECISLPIPTEIGKQTANPFSPSPSDPAVPTHDFWLIIRVGPTFEMPLIPVEQQLTPLQSPEGVAYLVSSPTVKDAKVEFILPKPASSADMEDLDSFEVLLKQYKSLHPEASALTGIETPILSETVKRDDTMSPPPVEENMRGKLVLINEETGQVIGELDQELNLDEDKDVAGDDTRKPVMLDFGDVIDGYAPTVQVRTVPADELDDWMLKGAHTLR
jgi:spartin